MANIEIAGTKIDDEGNQLIQVILTEGEGEEKSVLGEAFLNVPIGTPQQEIEIRVLSAAEGIADKARKARKARRNLSAVDWPEIAV